jgi:large subunit ribosomal protein L6
VSRVGRMPIPIPKGVTVTIEGNVVAVKGPNGELTRAFHPDMSVVRKENQLEVVRPSDQRTHRALHGLTRALLANMVTGVSEGFTKNLEIEGTGYRAELQGKTLVLNVGYSHPVQVPPPPGISFNVDKSGRNLTVAGMDKEIVGEISARIRAVRKPEPYKGKGIRYAGERIRRKAGKAGKVGK